MTTEIPEIRIPFNRPSFVGLEREYIERALKAGHISGDGDFTRRCSEYLEANIGVARALLTTSCTHALEMAAMLTQSEGDAGRQQEAEVIVPAFTFVSTANAFLLHGMRPVFADIRRDTLNIDEQSLESLVTERTRAVSIVHYAGVACQMDAIVNICQAHDLTLVEDNAHGLFGTFQGRQLGTFGRFAALSFHETKNFTCGEGGALLLNDPADITRAEIIREKGTNRSQFFRGQVDKYTWIEAGSSYLPSDLLAAILLAQLEAREDIQRRRQQIWDRYASALQPWAHDMGARLPLIPSGSQHPSHLFYVLMPSVKERDRLIAHLRARGIVSVFHYVPLHTSPVGASLGGKRGDCPVAEEISDALLRLPLYFGLDAGTQDEVIEAVMAYPG